MPAGKLAEHFDPQMGRPTKELYSMAGLLCIMEFRYWTHEEAADAYMFNIDAQDALNLNPEKQSLCRRTIERYIKLYRDDELAQASMHDVTSELVQLLVKVFEQQCDVVGKKVVVKKHTGGDIVCNPSDPDAITVSDFRIEDGEAKDDYGRTIIVPTCVECPAGQKPHRSFYDDFLKQINILQHPHVCAACPLLLRCPVRFASGWNLLRAASVRSFIAKLTQGGQAGQSALSFATSYRRQVTFSTLVVA